jgi:hypothetical protein
MRVGDLGPVNFANRCNKGLCKWSPVTRTAGFGGSYPVARQIQYSDTKHWRDLHLHNWASTMHTSFAKSRKVKQLGRELLSRRPGASNTFAIASDAAECSIKD